MKVSTFGILLGATMALPAALPNVASANTAMIQQADPNDAAPTRIRNGIEVIRPTDEEHTPEQASFAFDPVLKDTGIVVMMNTGRLDGPNGQWTGDQIQVGNIQGACFPIKIVPDASTDSGVTIAPDVNNFKYVSQRQSDENRAYHHPEVEALGNGLFAITQNWDRNNNTNTERYIQVVDSQCNLIPLTGNLNFRENNTSGVIMAKNNDNCSGRQAGGGASTFIYPDGAVGIMSEELCNGNGRDDGWANYITVRCAPDGSTCDVQKEFDVSVIDQEERSRGRCEQFDTDGSGTPDMSVCCGTEGNSQPQRDGVWCAGVDHATEDVIWKERVAYRGETASGQRTYAMRIKMMAERDIAGTPTGRLALQYQMHRGNNNNDRKGGYDDAVMIAMATPNRGGLNANEHIDITNAVITGQVEMTHSQMFQTFVGSAENPQPVFSFLAPNHNGSSLGASTLDIQLSANGALTPIGTTQLEGPADGQKYSKNFGDNPNDQGRNYTDCHVVPNPFADQPGPQQGIPVLNMCALTGKLSSSGIPSLKPDLFFEIWSSLEAPQAEEPGEPGGEDPQPEDPGTPDEPSQPEEPGAAPGAAPLGGCSTGGSSGSSAMMLLGLALVALRRRRK